jgi:hypothetical protein
MALGHTGMSRKSLFAQQLATDGSVLDVRLRTLAKDAGGMTTEDADVVQHGRFLQKLHVNGQFPVFARNRQATVGHLPAML